MRRAAPLLAVLLVLTGCTTSGQPVATPVSGSSPAASSATTAPSSAATTGSITVTPVRTFRLGKLQVMGLAVSPSAAFVSAGTWPTLANPDTHNRLLRLGLATGGQTVVATSLWRSGLVSSVATSGGWVVWVDQSDVLSTGGPGGSMAVLWRVWAKNVTSSRRILLQSNGSTPDAFPPELVGGAGYVGWQRFVPGQGAGVLLWRAGCAHVHTVLRHLGDFGLASISDGRLIFLGPAYPGAGKHPAGGDCWSAPIDGTAKPAVLTRTALVIGCGASGPHLVWTAHIDPTTNPKSLVSDVGSNPYTLTTMSLTSPADPRTINEGLMVSYQPVVGTDFTWWVGDHGTRVSALSSPATATPPRAGRALRVTTDRQLVAYGVEGNVRTVVRVARVVASP